MKFVLLLLWSLRWGADPSNYLGVPVLTPLDPLVSIEMLVIQRVPSGICVDTPFGGGVFLWAEPPIPDPPRIHDPQRLPGLPPGKPLPAPE